MLTPAGNPAGTAEVHTNVLANCSALLLYLPHPYHPSAAAGHIHLETKLNNTLGLYRPTQYDTY